MTGQAGSPDHPTTTGAAMRRESDALGSMELPAEALWGIHTARAIENFPLSGRPPHGDLVHAFGLVKLACALTNRDLGAWVDDVPRADAIERACREMASGALDPYVVVDALQGGAGTSTNMNVNEVIANRALAILGLPPGSYDRVSPLGDVNMHQSTNDTYPTALRLAAIVQLGRLEPRLASLVEAFQRKEREFSGVVKVGRTQMQDAVLVTLGREMGAYAEAFSRDRWRISKCHERLRVVNLGGTAVGTGLGAPRQFIFRVVDRLRELSGTNLARAENLLEATQNADVFVEVSGILKALATTLVKVSSDLRLMGSGPEAGLGEILLPPRQAGSSIMPGKVNPVVPEAVTQVGMLVMGLDGVIAMACASGSLELNPFLPLVAMSLLDSIGLLSGAVDVLRRHCVEGLAADPVRCAANVASSTATVTALVGRLGYETAQRVASRAREKRLTIREVVLERQLMTAEEFDLAISPEAVTRLGSG